MKTYSDHPETVRIREWRKAHPDRYAAHAAKYREKNRERLRQKQAERAASRRDEELARVKAWQAANPHKYRAAQDAINQRKLDAQERKAGRPRSDVCEACGEPDAKGKKLAFDHCHDKGHFRGWLCHRCNLALGLMRDSPALLNKLADYLIEDAMRQPLGPLDSSN